MAELSEALGDVLTPCNAVASWAGGFSLGIFTKVPDVHVWGTAWTWDHSSPAK